MREKDIKNLQNTLNETVKSANLAIEMLKKSTEQMLNENASLSEEEKNQILDVKKALVENQSKMKLEIKNTYEVFNKIK